jgi:REP element-mobilizing transposase RayT
MEYAGALYHVTSRGDRQEDIYLEDTDREQFLTVLSEVCERYNWVIHAYCLMSNHYHLLLETPDSNLSQGMCSGQVILATPLWAFQYNFSATLGASPLL